MTRSTHHPHYQAFLALLKAERRAAGVTQVQLAEALGNRQVFVSKIENGDRRLDVVELLEYFDGIGGDAVSFVAKLKAALKRSSKSSDRKLAVRPKRPTKRTRGR